MGSAPRDRVEVSGEQHLGLQGADALDGVDHGQCIPIAVAADGDQVRDVAEDRSERVAAQADLLVGQPDHHRVGGFAARGGDQLEAPVADGQRQPVVDDDVGGRGALGRQLLAEALLDRGDTAGELAGEGEGAAVGAVGQQALVVVAPVLPIGLRHNLGIRVAQRVQAADVVVVALGDQDVAHRRGVDGVEVGPVHRAFEAHAGVDDDAAVRRGQQVGVGQSR